MMPLIRLFLIFARIGLFTFGGGYGMLPLIQQEVIGHGWMDAETFYGYIGICESTPGPIAINMATFIGAHQAGLAGSLCATLGVVLPSFIVMLLIAALLGNFRENRWVRAAMAGIRPVVAGMILGMGLYAVARCLLTGLGQAGLPMPDIRQAGIAAVLIVFMLVRQGLLKRPFSPIGLILVAAGCGIAVYR